MIERYTRREMAELFSEESKYGRWLQVEVAYLEVLAEDGQIPPDDLAAIRTQQTVDPKRVAEIEAKVQHDVIAFLTALAEKVGPASRHVHFGLTSSDILDTALALQLRDASAIILKDVDALRDVLKRRAMEHRRTVCVGRTHGMHAEPTTFGLKMALYHDELGRARARIAAAARELEIGSLAGAVGTLAHVGPEIEERTLGKLGLGVDPIKTQVIQRDRHAAFVSALALLAASYEKIATEIRNLQRTDIREVEEPFATGQKGSSAMPHKRNPIACENTAGLARLFRGYVVAALENVALWHERDITHSSVERVVLPDACTLIDYMSHRLLKVLDGLKVYPERMRENLERTQGLVFSGQLLLALAGSGMSREDAYVVVQENAMRAWEERSDFRELAAADPRITSRLGAAQLEEAFSLDRQLRHVDAIFDRVFSSPASAPAGHQPDRKAS